MRAAGEAALDEIARLERQLSFYDPHSEISHINTNASRHPVKVEPALYTLLKQSLSIHLQSDKTFDLTIAPLMSGWGFVQNQGKWPKKDQIKFILESTGMHHLEFDDANRTIHFHHPGVLLDLGAIGKGYALERAGEILQDCGIDRALLHGGTSTVLAIGTPPDQEGWTLGIAPLPSSEDTQDLLSRVTLRNQSLSVSAIWGKSFMHEGKTIGHVLDPRTGYPVDGSSLAAVILPSPTEADALSTALLVLGKEGIPLLTTSWPEIRALVLAPSPSSTPTLWNWM